MCGLDPDLEKIPAHLLAEPDPIFSFCKQIIEETADFAVAYKPNIAFFEALGAKGWIKLLFFAFLLNEKALFLEL